MSLPESASRFSGLADVYDRYRPRYPDGAVDALLADLPPQPTIVDVGAGTGISTRALCDRGARAIAVEPNDDMRAFAKASGVDARRGTASATGLPANFADAVTSFQAFHWFANAEALAEFRRILHPGGRIGLVWNERDATDPFMSELRALERDAGEKQAIAGVDFSDERIEPLLRAAGFARAKRTWFDNVQVVDKTGLVGRIRSTSFAPRSGPALDTLLGALDELHARHADALGQVTLRYRAEVICSELASA